MTALRKRDVRGDVEAFSEIDSPPLDAATFSSRASELGLSSSEAARIERGLDRRPSETELCVFSAMWNEHCSYKSTRRHLGRLPSSGEGVIHGPGENAGAIDLGDGWVAAFKMESHNHPSYIEPRNGAATGSGGILRDVFCMGARPLAVLDCLRFGSPDAEGMRGLVEGVSAGIGAYGNSFGVPTAGGETRFHGSFDRNILVNVMAVGASRRESLISSQGCESGAVLLYVGARTGRDGVHGASMASQEFSSSSDAAEKRPTVQIADPFAGRRLMEACLDLAESGRLLAMQDMGAAGILCASTEMAAKGGAGASLDLDAVPLRDSDMSASEILLSESQERALVAVREEDVASASSPFLSRGLEATPIGRAVAGDRFVAERFGRREASLPLALLIDESPSYDRPRSRFVAPAPTPLSSLPRLGEDVAEATSRLLSSFDFCSKRAIWEQYDHLVGGRVYRRPGGDAAVVAFGDATRALAMSVDSMSAERSSHPRRGASLAVAECRRNLIACGATPLAITDNLNFGNPERPEIMTQLVEAIEGIAEACEAFGLPVVSGNVSLYNETDGAAIRPCPSIGGVGLIDDVGRLRESSRPIRAGDSALLIGGSERIEEADGMATASSSSARRILSDDEGGSPPDLDYDLERRAGDFVLAMIGSGGLFSVRDVSDGGLSAALGEACLEGDVGATIDFRCLAESSGFGDRVDALAFWELQGAYLATGDFESLGRLGRDCGVRVLELGCFEGRELHFVSEGRIPIDGLRRLHEGRLRDYLDGA